MGSQERKKNLKEQKRKMDLTLQESAINFATGRIEPWKCLRSFSFLFFHFFFSLSFLRDFFSLLMVIWKEFFISFEKKNVQITSLVLLCYCTQYILHITNSSNYKGGSSATILHTMYFVTLTTRPLCNVCSLKFKLS